MPQDLSSPFYLVAGAAFFTALTYYLGWPKIAFRTQRQRHNGIDVIDVMFTVSGRKQWQASSGNLRPHFEFSIYIIGKRNK